VRQRPLNSSVRHGWGQCFRRVALAVSSRSVLLPACAESAGSHFHASVLAWPACALCTSGLFGARGVDHAVSCSCGRARAQATTISLASALAAWRKQSLPASWLAGFAPSKLRGLTVRSSGPLRIGGSAIMRHRGSGRLAQALCPNGESLRQLRGRNSFTSRGGIF